MIRIETILKEVSIYRSGCEMIRRGEVHLAPGRHACRIYGLSAGSDTGSVRVKTSGGLSAANVQTVYADADEQKELTREIDEQIRLAEADIEACDMQAKLWKDNLSFSSEAPDLKLMEQYAVILPEKLREIAERKIRLEKQKEELLKKREETEKEMSCPYVEAILECEAEGDYVIQTEAYDYGASWHPVYEIRADGESEELSLRLRAAMRQTTGKDWEQVSLRLYTGNPSHNADIPVLPSAHLKFRSAPILSTARPRLAGSMAKAMMADGAAEMMNEETAMLDFTEAKRNEAEVSAGETMTEYELKGVWDLKADGRDVMADLSEKQIACDFHVIAVPKKDSSAYLAAAVKTADIQDILDTGASVYLNGMYAGEVTVRADLTKETCELSLGRDETVSVRRTQKKKYTSSVLLKGQYKTEYVYETTVVSHKQKPCRITVIDQIPVSEEKTIIVEKGDLSSAVLNEETGEVVFEAQLQPQESRTFVLSWNVLWPKDRQITETAVSAVRGPKFCPVCGSMAEGAFCPECGARIPG